MELMFQGGSEVVNLLINRASKDFLIKSRLTGNKYCSQPWKMLFDKGQEVEQEAETDTMDDGSFIERLTESMVKKGYKLVSLKR